MGLIPIKEICEHYDWSIDQVLDKIKCGLIRAHFDHHAYGFIDEDLAKAAFLTAEDDIGIASRNLQLSLNRPTRRPLDIVTSAHKCFLYLREFPEYGTVTYRKILDLIKGGVIKANTHLVRQQRRYRCTRRSMRADLDAYFAGRSASRLVKSGRK